MENPTLVLLNSSGEELGLEDDDAVEAFAGPVEVIDLCASPPGGTDADEQRLLDLRRTQNLADRRKARRREKRKNRRKWYQCFVPQPPLVNGAREECRGDITNSVEVNKVSESFNGAGSPVIIDLDMLVLKENEITADLNSSSSVREVERTSINNMEVQESISDTSKDIVTSITIESAEEGKLPYASGIEETTIPTEPHRNPVLRKGVPRYFDYPDGFWEMCHNCNENGHLAGNCPTSKRRCYICGCLGHEWKKCKQKYKCSFLQRKDHLVNNCAEKHEGNRPSKICVRCGNSGHDMTSCRTDYSPDDLKKIRCYVCKNIGHICCVDFRNAGPRKVSCFKCGMSGHVGMVCKNVVGDYAGIRSFPCNKYVKEGHKKCWSDTKPVERIVASSSSNQHDVKEGLGSLSRQQKQYVPPMKEIQMKEVKLRIGWR